MRCDCLTAFFWKEVWSTRVAWWLSDKDFPKISLFIFSSAYPIKPSPSAFNPSQFHKPFTAETLVAIPFPPSQENPSAPRPFKKASLDMDAPNEDKYVAKYPMPEGGVIKTNGEAMSQQEWDEQCEEGDIAILDSIMKERDLMTIIPEPSSSRKLQYEQFSKMLDDEINRLDERAKKMQEQKDKKETEEEKQKRFEKRYRNTKR